jgi:hypothetical protein
VFASNGMGYLMIMAGLAKSIIEDQTQITNELSRDRAKVDWRLANGREQSKQIESKSILLTF